MSCLIKTLKDSGELPANGESSGKKHAEKGCQIKSADADDETVIIAVIHTEDLTCDWEANKGSISSYIRILLGGFLKNKNKVGEIHLGEILRKAHNHITGRIVPAVMLRLAQLPNTNRAQTQITAACHTEQD
jgi:hypothetical protein